MVETEIGRAIPAGAAPAVSLGRILHSVSAPPRDAGEGAFAALGLLDEAGAGASPTQAKGGLRRHLLRLLDGYRSQTTAKRRVRGGVTYPSRLACCGLQRCETGVELVQFGEGDARRAQWVGVIRCRSKACPYCLGVRRSQDGRTVAAASGMHHENYGGDSSLVTLTVRHSRVDELREHWRGVRKSWRRVLQGRAWVAARERWSLADFVVREEPTWGENGPHVHLHVLFLHRRRLSDAEFEEMRAWLFPRWADRVAKVLGEQARPQEFSQLETREPGRGLGVDVKRTTTAEYVAKLGFELADSGYKGAAPGHATPLQLLTAYVVADDRSALELYQEYESTARGTPDLTWSKGMRAYRDAARKALKEEWKEERKGAVALLSFPGDVIDAMGSPARCDVQSAGREGGRPAAARELGRVCGALVAVRVLKLTEQREHAAGLWRQLTRVDPEYLPAG